MILAEIVSYDKDGNITSANWRIRLFRKLFLSIILILVATLSFGVGRLTVVGDREPIKIEFDPELTTNTTQTAKALNALQSKPQAQSPGEVVTSSKGTKYHYAHCSGAKQISEANKIVFTSPEAAEASGYTLASNCKPK